MKCRRVIAALPLLLGSCIEAAPQTGQHQPRQWTPPEAAARPTPTPTAAPAPVVAPAATGAAPAGLPPGAQPSGALFGGAIEVLGYKVEPASAQPGQEVAVTLWLKVLAQPTVDDMIFVHVDDSEGRSERVNGDHWPASHKTPMPQWKVGDVVVDQFSFVLSGFAESSAAIIWMGFWAPESDARLPITNANQVKTDGNNRLALVEIPVLH